MNLFLVLLGLFLGYHLILCLYASLKEGFPTFCKVVFTKARRFILYLVASSRRSQEEEEKAPSVDIKQLNRWPADTPRRRLFAYLAHSEESNSHPLWKAYVSLVPPYYRQAVAPTIETPHPLPRWLESLLSFFTGPVLKFLALYLVLLLLYPYIVMLSGSGGAGVHADIVKTTQLALEQHLEVSIEACTQASTEELCFLHLYDRLTLRDALASVCGRSLNFTEKQVTLNKTLAFLLDEEDRLYYAIDVMVPANSATTSSLESLPVQADDESVQIRRYINTELQLMPFLKSMKETCVCSIFLNIVSDINFLYDESVGRWLVLREATIYRNNSFAELTASRIAFNERSRFYRKHKQWEEGELVHYDSFVVEYTEPSLPLPVAEDDDHTMQAMRNANDKLRDGGYKEARLFKRIIQAPVRKQMPLSGNDAICFIYCDTLKKRYLN